MHEIKTISDLLKGQSVRHKLIDFELLAHVLLHQFGNAVDTLVSWEKFRRTDLVEERRCACFIKRPHKVFAFLLSVLAGEQSY